MKKIAIALLCMLIAGVITGCGISSREEKATQSEDNAAPRVETVETLQSDNAVITGADMSEPEVPAEQPAELLKIMADNDLEINDLCFRQLVIVTAHGTDAVVTLWENDGNTWAKLPEQYEAKIGRNGATSEKREGDGSTPLGLFSITTSFGTAPCPGNRLPFKEITSNSYWVDDSESAHYNQWVEGTDNKDWNSAEHLIDYPSPYALAFVIDYNMDPVIPGAGSAIFFHCGGNSATSGCVATSYENVRRIITWLQPDYRPHILVQAMH